MITSIRDVRHAKGLSLQQVAERCTPPTTAQTIGRLETGTRTVSVDWLNRVADALGVAAADLVRLPEQAELAVVAELGVTGARAPRRAAREAPPRPAPGTLALRVVESVGEYRAGDLLWCERLAPADFGAALHRDILAPRPAGRFVFGRLIAEERDALLLLPSAAGMRPDRLPMPPWIAVARRLIRPL